MLSLRTIKNVRPEQNALKSMAQRKKDNKEIRYALLLLLCVRDLFERVPHGLSMYILLRRR
jgi:hypothetical protein